MHDDQCSDQPEPQGETPRERAKRLDLERRGLIERDGTYYRKESDLFSRTVLMAQVRELREHLRRVNVELGVSDLQFRELAELCKEAAATSDRSAALCDRLASANEELRAQIDALTEENDTLRGQVNFAKQRPLLSAVANLSDHFLKR